MLTPALHGIEGGGKPFPANGAGKSPMKVRSSDAEISYQTRGEGSPLVLLHPFPANHGVWEPAAELLADRYRLVIPDLRAHGDSGVGEGPATMDKHAADVSRVCDEAGLGRAVFAGISIGGYVLFEFWRRFRERVAALILCDTRAQPDTEEGRANRLKAADEVEQHGSEAFIESMIPKLLGDTTRRNRPDLVERARGMMTCMTPQGIAAVQRGMAVRPDSVPTLSTINVPTLIIVGEEDVLTPAADAQLMHEHVPGSIHRVIPRAGHYAPFEQHEAVAGVMAEFLAALQR
jgi:3-oxoadipate enol-lactonase